MSYLDCTDNKNKKNNIKIFYKVMIKLYMKVKIIDLFAYKFIVFR